MPLAFLIKNLYLRSKLMSAETVSRTKARIVTVERVVMVIPAVTAKLANSKVTQDAMTWGKNAVRIVNLNL
jgi:hypothetical protein